MINIKNVCKSYGDLTVYNNFNLQIEDKKITCVLGESGSGKTTLLNMIAGLCPYEGEITPVKCSYVFQQHRLFPNLTVFKNLKLVCSDEEKIRDMLKKVGLEQKINGYIGSLSGGQAQRVSLARAFLFNAEVVLLDEPFTSLDLKTKIEMMDLFKNLLTDSGKTAVFVTHSPSEATYLADRVLLLSGGQICLDLPCEGGCAYGSDTPVKRQLISQMLK